MRGVQSFSRRWHRRAGITSAIFVIFLGLSGLALNHGRTLGLDRTTVNAEWLLDWYGLGPRGDPVGFDLGDRWLVWLGGRIFLDGNESVEVQGEPVGALATTRLIVFATRDSFVLLAPGDGSVVERMGSQSLPGRLARLGRDTNGATVVDTDAGLFRAKESFLGWEALDRIPEVDWTAPEAVPEDVRATVLERFRGDGLPADRVLLDFHTGRILGEWGVVLVDAATIAFIFLAGTGLVMWFRTRRRRRRGR